MADNSREKLMRETARVILQTIYDCPESERNEKIIQLAKGFRVEIVFGEDKNYRMKTVMGDRK